MGNQNVAIDFVKNVRMAQADEVIEVDWYLILPPRNVSHSELF
jgi:hypothetical protein